MKPSVILYKALPEDLQKRLEEHFTVTQVKNLSPETVAQHAEAGEVAALLDYRHQAPFAVRAHPTDEHFLPLFFALGAAMPTATPPTAQRIAGQMQYGVISMDSLRFDPPSPSEICV